MLDTIADYTYEDARVRLDKIQLIIRGYRLTGTDHHIHQFLLQLTQDNPDSICALTSHNDNSQLGRYNTFNFRSQSAHQTARLPLFSGKMRLNKPWAQGVSHGEVKIEFHLNLNPTRLIHYQRRHQPSTQRDDLPPLEIFREYAQISGENRRRHEALDRNDNVFATVASRHRASLVGWQELLEEYILSIEEFFVQQALEYGGNNPNVLTIHREPDHNLYQLKQAEVYWEVPASHAILSVDRIAPYVKRYCNDYAETDYAIDEAVLPAGEAHLNSSKSVRGGISAGRAFSIYSKLRDRIRIEARTYFPKASRYGRTQHTEISGILRMIRGSIEDSQVYFRELSAFIGSYTPSEAQTTPFEYLSSFYRIVGDISLAEELLEELVVNLGIPNPVNQDSDRRNAVERLQRNGLIVQSRRRRGSRYTVHPDAAHAIETFRQSV